MKMVTQVTWWRSSYTNTNTNQDFQAQI